MARSALLGLASVGLSLATVLVAFPGCYGDVGEGNGNCEDDGNPCTVDTCASGGTIHTPAPEGQECSLGENAGKCSVMGTQGSCALDCLTGANGAVGMCKCASRTDCPTDELCADWACSMGECARTPKPDGHVADTLADADCKHVVCQAGKTNTTQDDADKPADIPGDCQIPTCENMAPKSAADNNDNPADSKGDCRKPTCANGSPSTANDDSDEPDDTGCVNNSCTNGTAVAMNATIGTVCMGGVCNAMGACVDCLSLTEWGACGASACKVKKCDGETCGTPSECKSDSCADNVCCDTNCTEECKSCNVGNAKGVCTNIPYYQEDMMYTPSGGGPSQACNIAIAGAVCDGNGKCLKIAGTACTMGAQCISGTCTGLKCIGATGEACAIPTDCVSGMCVMGSCK